jgi:hypothetical protein
MKTELPFCFMDFNGFQKNTAAVEESDKKIGRSRMAEHSERLAPAARKSHKKK